VQAGYTDEGRGEAGSWATGVKVLFPVRGEGVVGRSGRCTFAVVHIREEKTNQNPQPQNPNNPLRAIKSQTQANSGERAEVNDEKGIRSLGGGNKKADTLYPPLGSTKMRSVELLYEVTRVI